MTTHNGSSALSTLIVWGSSTGYTEEVASALFEELQHRVDAIVNVADIELKDLEAFDVLILGAPTWHVGELQDDWDYRYKELQSLDLRGKLVALFGCGDAVCYPDTYQDALGILWEALQARGATLVGRWSIEGYDFVDSRALTPDGKHFVGLAIDELSESKLTEERITRWARQLEGELAEAAAQRTIPAAAVGVLA